jgi:hypothetical protein
MAKKTTMNKRLKRLRRAAMDVLGEVDNFSLKDARKLTVEGVKLATDSIKALTGKDDDDGDPTNNVWNNVPH